MLTTAIPANCLQPYAYTYVPRTLYDRLSQQQPNSLYVNFRNGPNFNRPNSINQSINQSIMQLVTRLTNNSFHMSNLSQK